MHEPFGVIVKYVGILHTLHHLLKVVLLSFSKSVVELNTVGLVLLVFRGQFEVLFVTNGLEELSDVSLYFPLFGSEALFILQQPFALFLLVLNH